MQMRGVGSWNAVVEQEKSENAKRRGLWNIEANRICQSGSSFVAARNGSHAHCLSFFFFPSRGSPYLPTSLPFSSFPSLSFFCRFFSLQMPTAPPTGDETVTVSLGDRSYPIVIGSSLLSRRAETLRAAIKGSSVLIVTNDTLAPLYLDAVVSALGSAPSPAGSSGKPLSIQTVVLPDGEQYKTVSSLELIWTAALEAHLDRAATFVALGGGVVGDVTGFAAASYQRGVPFVQIPTTVMSQVDSSVGGKTGVNHPLGKNMLGAFHQPNLVFVDLDMLRTLPQREFCSGLAEVIKYGLIRDPAFFEWLEANVQPILERSPTHLARLIRRCCEDKADVVAEDEREGAAGVRATLNLGHTFGHAIEAGLGYGAWLHGEAVAAGMAIAAEMSAKLGWISDDLAARAVALLEAFDLPTRPPANMTPEVFLSYMRHDKKNLGGDIRLVLLKGDLGNCVVTRDYDPAALQSVLEGVCQRAKNLGDPIAVRA